MEETKKLVRYLQTIEYPTLDEPTINMAKMCIQDFIGVSIAGSQKKESEIFRAYYRNKPNAPEASAFSPGFPGTSCDQAAALNAVYGHVMDMDDVHNASITHMGVVTIPTAFAIGQRDRRSGKQLIEAIVTGYETGARIGEAINPSSYKYWHTTAVVGSLSAGATAGKLLKLSEEELLNCLGTAGTQAAGLWEFLESGCMSKVIHTSNANLCGLRSAELAKLGFTGASTILEGERAFMKALASEYDPEVLTTGYGEGYRINSNSFKPYACCRHTHSANYCIEKILSAHALNPDDIVSITDDTYAAAVQTTNNPYPENPYAAKFSLQFCIAASLILKDLSDKTFTAENISNRQIKALMEKIKIHVSKQLDQEFQEDPNQWSHRITICLADGSKIVEQVDYPIGDFKNPFDWPMADNKFLLLTKDVIGEEKARGLMEAIRHLDECDDINALFEGATKNQT